MFLLNGDEGRGPFRRRDGRAGRFEPMSFQQVDEARFVLRPAGVRFYPEDQYDFYALEQLRRFEAEGETKAQPLLRVAERTEPKAASVRREIESLEQRAQLAESEADETRRALSPFVRRPGFEKARYWSTNLLLLGGDVAGVAGAALWLGELPVFAVAQAVASGTAAITAGLMGRELADSRRARVREQNPRTMPRELRRFRHLFTGGDQGESLANVMGYAAVTVSLLIGSSVAALRWGTEGPLSAVVFGGLALAISGASFVNSYILAAEIADQIDRAEAVPRRLRRKIRRRSGARALRQHNDAVAAVESIRNEARLNGEAAAFAVLALKAQQLSRHPGVVGHGYPVTNDTDAASSNNGDGGS